MGTTSISTTITDQARGGGSVAAGREPIVEITGLQKEFVGPRASVVALAGIDLTLERGEFMCVVGPSGCGKTTLLNILGGLESPSGGRIAFHPRQPEHPLLSIVFQEQGVFPWLTVLDNAAFGLMARGVPRATREKTARAYLAKMGLDGFERAYPRELSGGMRQRVNVARAFANDPEILLMDEPFASVDEQTKLLLQDGLLQLWEAERKTVLFITHSVDEAIRLADRIIVMTARPGRIKAEIPVRIPRPRDVFELQTDADFVRIRGQVWQALKEEVLAHQAEEERR